jgi:hypothetical protein
MQVQKFELYIKYDTETGVVQVIQTDNLGRTIDPIALQVTKEFIMTFASLFSDEQQTAIVNLSNQKENLLNDKTNLLNDKVALQEQVLSLTATINRLAREVASLQPWNKRWIDAEKFVARFTSVQTRKVYDPNSTDTVLIGARQLLDTYIASNYYIDLDDPQVTGLTAYMVSVTPQILTPEERENVLRDSDSSERYVPNEL